MGKIIVGVPDNNWWIDTSDIWVTRALQANWWSQAVSAIARITAELTEIYNNTPRHPLSDHWHSIETMTPEEKLRVLESLQFGDACWIQLKDCPIQPLSVSVEYIEWMWYQWLVFDPFINEYLGKAFNGYLNPNDPNLLKIIRVSSREESIRESLWENTDPDQIYIWTIWWASYRVKIKFISGIMVVVNDVDEKWNRIEANITYSGIKNFLEQAIPEKS